MSLSHIAAQANPSLTSTASQFCQTLGTKAKAFGTEAARAFTDWSKKAGEFFTKMLSIVKEKILFAWSFVSTKSKEAVSYIQKNPNVGIAALVGVGLTAITAIAAKCLCCNGKKNTNPPQSQPQRV